MTFRVDLSEESVPGHTAYVNGTFNGWCGDCAPMYDADGDGVWELTLALPMGPHEYKFTTNGWSGLIENFAVGTPCTSTTYDGPNVYTNRTFSIGTSPLDFAVVCFNSCSACASAPVVYHDVTFRVQMPDPEMEAVLEVDGVEYPMTTGMWGAHEVTASVQGGQDFGYRFGTPAGPLGMAWETVSGSCVSQGMRSGWIEDDVELAVVCFSSCTACQGCADPFSANFDPLAAADSPLLCVKAQPSPDAHAQPPPTSCLAPNGITVPRVPQWGVRLSGHQFRWRGGGFRCSAVALHSATRALTPSV